MLVHLQQICKNSSSDVGSSSPFCFSVLTLHSRYIIYSLVLPRVALVCPILEITRELNIAQEKLCPLKNIVHTQMLRDWSKLSCNCAYVCGPQLIDYLPRSFGWWCIYCSCGPAVGHYTAVFVSPNPWSVLLGRIGGLFRGV